MSASFALNRRQCLLNRDTAQQPIAHRFNGHPSLFCPRTHALCSAVKREHAVEVSPVSGLRFPCCPTAITRLVITIAVFTLKRVFRARLRPHVSVEVLKRIQPPFAHLDSPASIVRKCLAVFVSTSSLHSIPRAVFGRLYHSMRPIRDDWRYRSQASARSGFPASQLIPANNGCSTAAAKGRVTEALPKRFSRGAVSSVADDPKKSERRLVGHVFEGMAMLDSLGFSHDANLLAGLLVARADAGCSLRSARFILPEMIAA